MAMEEPYYGSWINPSPITNTNKQKKCSSELSEYEEEKKSYNDVTKIPVKYLKFRAGARIGGKGIYVSICGTLYLAELAWAHDLIRRLLHDKTPTLADTGEAGRLLKHA